MITCSWICISCLYPARDRIYGMSFATVSHTPDIELPNHSEFECPDDVVSLIEEWHQGLHKVLISKMVRRGNYKPVGVIVCQETNDKHSRPEPTPSELGDYIMCFLQHEIEETDDPGKYKVVLKGPGGKGGFEKSKHIDLTGQDGQPRTVSMMQEGDMLEQQTAYIGELHSQMIGMIELVTNSHKVVVNENREMMKILSEATRKHGEIEALRLKHQLEMKMHEDEISAQEAEADRGLAKFREGLDVFKNTGAAEELIRAVAKKIQGKDKDREKEEAKDSPAGSIDSESDSDETQRERNASRNGVNPEPSGVPEAPKKKARFSKSKSTSKKKGSKKLPKGKEPEAEVDEGSPETPDSLQKMVDERQLVMAAEALKMTINEKSQWKAIHKILSDKQSDILDDIFASTTNDEVIKNAQLLYDAEGMMKLIALNEELDDQQKAFIGLVMKHVER